MALPLHLRLRIAEHVLSAANMAARYPVTEKEATALGDKAIQDRLEAAKSVVAAADVAMLALPVDAKPLKGGG